MAILPAARVETFYRQAGQNVENVFHVLCPLPTDPADLQAIAAVVNDWIRNTLRPNQANNVTYFGVRVSDVNGVGGGYELAGDGQPGTHSGNPLANHVTFAIKKVTALQGPAFRGRFYHVGLTDTHSAPATPNTLLPTEVFALVSTYAALYTALNTAGYPLQVVQFDRTTHPPTPLTTVPVIAITARDDVIDSQRRRLPLRGS